MYLFPDKESVSINPWKGKNAPKKILWVRLEALGDLFATLPFAARIKEKYPDAQLDLLTRSDFAELPQKLAIFNRVYPLKGCTSFWKKALYILMMFPKLWLQRYDIVIDLQRNRLSQTLRKCLIAKSWIEFDRFSSQSVLLRNQWSVNQLGIGGITPKFDLGRHFPLQQKTLDLLGKNGWKNGHKLILFNPAGLYPTRNWPIERYIELAKLWLEKEPDTFFLILGVPTLAQKAQLITQELPEKIINLVGQTSLSEAYYLLTLTSLILTEDSGLGHIGWLSGKKTLMLLGSTRSDWTRPIGSHTACFDSSDLPCGDCMLATCIHPSPICLDRRSAQEVFEKGWELYIESKV